MILKVNPVTPLASPLGEEGHEVAKGWTVVRMIMTLDMDVIAERRHYNTHHPRGRHHNLRPERAVKLKNLKNLRGEALSTLTPRVCPKAKTPLSPLNPLYLSRGAYGILTVE